MDITSEAVNVFIAVPLRFLTVITFAPCPLNRAIQRCCFKKLEQCLKYVVTKKFKNQFAASERSIPINIQKDFHELFELQWKKIRFYNKEYVFPSLSIALFNYNIN